MNGSPSAEAELMMNQSLLEQGFMFPGRRRGRKRKEEKLAEIAMAEALARRQMARAVASFEPGNWAWKRIMFEQMSHHVRLWYFSSIETHSSNAHAQPSTGARCLIFGWTLRRFPYFMCVNSEGSGETAWMRRLA